MGSPGSRTKFINLDVAGDITRVDPPVPGLKCVSARFTAPQSSLSSSLDVLLKAPETDFPLDAISSLEIMILDFPPSPEKNLAWKHAGDYPQNRFIASPDPKLPSRIIQSISNMQNIVYLHLCLESFTPEQAKEFIVILGKTEKFNRVRILRVSGISDRFVSDAASAIIKTHVPNLVGLDMGSVAAGSELYRMATARKDLKRLAIAVVPSEFVLNPTPALEGFTHFQGGRFYFKKLEWLAIDEMVPKEKYPELGNMRDYFLFIKERFLKNLEKLPDLRRLRVTIRPAAVAKAGLIEGMRGVDDDSIKQWYWDLVTEIEEELPQLESICIFGNWPTYIEGGNRAAKQWKNAEAQKMPFRAMWPFGLRDIDGR